MYAGEVIALEDSEAEELLDLVDREHTERVRLTIRTLLHTGLRASEFAHLKRSWLHPAKTPPRIQVPAHDPCDCSDCRQKAESSKGKDLSDYWKPKSTRGARNVPVVHRDTWDALSSFIDEHGEVGVGRGAVWARVRRVNEDMDLPHPLTPHILRHSYATMMVSRGLSIEHLQGIMGHASIENTQVYVHLTGDQNAAAAAAVAGDYGGGE
jgi:integrase/recombinase XerD